MSELILTRRTFLKGVLATAATLVLPSTLEQNVEYVRRVWALDRTMVAAKSILGDGYLLQSPDGRIVIAVKQWPLPKGTAIAEGPVVGGTRMADYADGRMARLSGPVYVTPLGEPLPHIAGALILPRM